MRRMNSEEERGGNYVIRDDRQCIQAPAPAQAQAQAQAQEYFKL